MVFQPTPWQSAAYFFEDRRQDLAQTLPDDMRLMPRGESADRQDRIEFTPYKGFGFKKSRLGPHSREIAPTFVTPLHLF